MYSKNTVLFTGLLLLFSMMGFSEKQDLPPAKYLKPILFEQNSVTYIYIGKTEKPVVYSAFTMLQNDVKAVFNTDIQLTTDKKKAQIIVSSSGELQGKWEAFQIDIQNNILFILGSDARGKAYGLLELSRMIGVSPWEWWADARPEKRSLYLLSEINTSEQSPSVQYRGIFLNDEDWGLLPWATQNFNYELIDGIKLTDNPRWKGAIGAQAYERIFQLLLRLRANTIWPAMHECTVPFYFVKGNKEMADKYGIVVGASHCEPLMRNSASEWDISGKGDYNFISNRQNVLDYWSERLEELQNSENIFTIGMRGKHDGMMQGVKTPGEHKNALSQIIPAQQELLKKHINRNLGKIPQAFIPYKEVLEVYDNGLAVPGYVTLVWCDDNYGYIRRLSNDREQLRSGGTGVYYHVSYWGRPHDYLWLASTSPALVHSEMKRAYKHGAKKLWILNVGDIKPAEYLTEFFMDLAWNIRLCDTSSVFSHLNQWAEREFGKQNADAIASVMKEYYRLANIRKPEFTGWSRVEEAGYGRSGLTPVKNTGYNPIFNNELQRRINDYLSIEKQTTEIKRNIPGNRKTSFFQLVEYPVRGASLINQKWLYAQSAHDYTDSDPAKEYAGKSQEAYSGIERITEEYNSMENGKWNGMMNFRPRNLPVFDKPDFLLKAGFQSEKQTKDKNELSHVAAQNASQAINLPDNGTAVEGLGHSFSAVQMRQGSTLTFRFDIPSSGEYRLKIATLPNHDVDGKGMKIILSVDGKEIRTFDYRVAGRSETWKENVLRGQVISTVKHHFPKAGKVNISIKALTPYIILDQIMLLQGDMNFYEFPVKTG
jgi:hypothetical protein